jgi:putative membrane protein insertion efficiency factor
MIKITVTTLISFIKIYRLIISPYIKPSCRYLPTCSEYTIDCLKTYGLTKGLFKSIKRILSCHPIKILGGGEGFDPAIKNIKVKK